MEGRKSGQPMGVRKEGCISRTKSHWGAGKMAQGLKALVAKSDDLEKKITTENSHPTSTHMLCHTLPPRTG